MTASGTDSALNKTGSKTGNKTVKKKATIPGIAFSFKEDRIYGFDTYSVAIPDGFSYTEGFKPESASDNETFALIAWTPDTIQLEKWESGRITINTASSGKENACPISEAFEVFRAEIEAEPGVKEKCKEIEPYKEEDGRFLYGYVRCKINGRRTAFQCIAGVEGQLHRFRISFNTGLAQEKMVRTVVDWLHRVQLNEAESAAGTTENTTGVAAVGIQENTAPAPAVETAENTAAGTTEDTTGVAAVGIQENAATVSAVETAENIAAGTAENAAAGTSENIASVSSAETPENTVAETITSAVTSIVNTTEAAAGTVENAAAGASENAATVAATVTAEIPAPATDPRLEALETKRQELSEVDEALAGYNTKREEAARQVEEAEKAYSRLLSDQLIEEESTKLQIRSLEAKSADMEGVITELKRKRRDVREKKEEYRKTISNLEPERRAKSNEIARERKALEDKLNLLADEKAEIQEEKADKKSKLQSVFLFKKKKQQEYDEVKSRLKEKNSEISACDEEIENLNVRVMELKRNADKERVRLNKEISLLDEQEKELRKSITAEEEAVKKIAKEVSVLQEKIKNYKLSITNAANDLAECKKQCEIFGENISICLARREHILREIEQLEGAADE